MMLLYSVVRHNKKKGLFIFETHSFSFDHGTVLTFNQIIKMSKLFC